MAMLFTGTSYSRAQLLIELGWQNLAMTTDIKLARRMACYASIEDACPGVVLAWEAPGECAADGIMAVQVAPKELKPVETTDDQDTPEKRLGAPEHAEIGGIADGILNALDQTHTFIRKSLTGDAELPRLAGLLKKKRGEAGEWDESEAEQQDAISEQKHIALLKKNNPDITPQELAQRAAVFRKNAKDKRAAKRVAIEKKKQDKARADAKKAVTKSTKAMERTAHRKIDNHDFKPKKSGTKPKAPKSGFKPTKSKTTVKPPKSGFARKAPSGKTLTKVGVRKAPTTKAPIGADGVGIKGVHFTPTPIKPPKQKPTKPLKPEKPAPPPKPEKPPKPKKPI